MPLLVPVLVLSNTLPRPLDLLYFSHVLRYTLRCREQTGDGRPVVASPRDQLPDAASAERIAIVGICSVTTVTRVTFHSRYSSQYFRRRYVIDDGSKYTVVSERLWCVI